MKKRFLCLLAVLMLSAAMMTVGVSAAGESCGSAMVVSESTTISDVTINKDVYISKDVTLSVSGTVAINGDVYIFGTLSNSGTLTVSGTVYCLHYGSMLSAGSYNYGYLYSYGSLKVTSLVVKDSYLSVSIPSANHTAGTAVTENTVAATCATKGSYDTVVYCTVCGDEISRTTVEVAKTEEHNIDIDYVTKEATCSEEGILTHECSICGKTWDVPIETTEHTYDSGQVTTAATYVKTGVITYTCTVCGDTYTEEVARLGLHEGLCAIDAFTDITSLTSWYYTAVDYVYHSGIMSGMGNGIFAPDNTLTRAQVVQILYAQAGSPSVEGVENPFADVPSDKWYYNAIVWAYHNGVTSGTSATTFSPEDNVTREQIITLLYNYTVKVSGVDMSGDPTDDLSAYTDAASVSSWAVTAVKWSVGNGIVKGTSDTTLSPGNTATRAQAAQILYGYRINYLGLEIE